MSVKIHISGITTQDALAACISSNVQFVSAVFNQRSDYYIIPELAGELFDVVPDQIHKIAIFENPSESDVTKALKHFKTKLVQLEGDEDRQFIAKLKNQNLTVIKSVYLDNEDDNRQLSYYGEFVDYFMVCGHRDIRNGLKRAWAISDFAFLRRMRFNRPWFLGGELNKLNARRALQDSQAKMITVSSSLEITPGVKDPNLIKDFVKTINRLDIM